MAESRNFNIVQTIAAGGTAVLYKAVQVSLDRVVAIKRLHPHLTQDDNFTRRFVLEANAAASLSALYLDQAGSMPIVIPPATEPLVVGLGAETDVQDSLETVNFGVVGGGGVLVPLGPGDLVLEARFQLGLTTI